MLIHEDDVEKNVRRTILTWLVRRDYTKHEITQKLLAKGYDLTVITAIIDDMSHNGLINEDRFTEHYIHFRRGKGFGPLRIIADLKARGINAETIAKHVNITDNAWLNDVQTVWRKHFKAKHPVDGPSRAKQQRFLLQRGFTSEHIRSLLDHHDESTL